MFLPCIPSIYCYIYTVQDTARIAHVHTTLLRGPVQKLIWHPGIKRCRIVVAVIRPTHALPMYQLVDERRAVDRLELRTNTRSSAV